ncbi:hypothetical protein CONPUDRAFT_68843 [Coniophora puteana RWD-64-598 SS2]|uniref:Uncharacterized protein n=1 Tax=Coniophora puteana (strain RWD-64-598) TaxID=741705 RepID=A0A5M3N4E1_CONPW|nr:uncharacterized protein CONPUDRAFT_68843 [Coniophora puteana RWD-64-598 SS2]EIW86290.1 hypothetical protein CONPUDRAFT_68843 [Coniophora puteana RWD-64-598 SS2]
MCELHEVDTSATGFDKSRSSAVEPRLQCYTPSQPSSSVTPWHNTPFHLDPTVDGLQAMKYIDIISICWDTTLLALMCFDLHNDGHHLKDNPAFHPLTLVHYSLGLSRPTRTTQEERRAYFDVRTDHVESSVSLFLHHPGTVNQKKGIEPKHLQASSYLNPCFLALHPETHITIAKIAQTFIKKVACVNAEDFRNLCTQQCWPYGGFSNESSTINFSSLPIISKPTSRPSTQFMFQGHPHGQLANIVSYGTKKPPPVTFLLDIDGTSDTYCLISLIHVIQLPPSAGGHAKSRSGTEAYKLVGKLKSGPCFGDVNPQSQGSNLRVHFILAPSLLAPSVLLSPPKSSEPNSSAQACQFTTNQHSVILPFGLYAEATLDELLLLDSMHNVCTDLLKDYMPSKWQSVLQKVFPNMLSDSLFTVATCLKKNAEDNDINNLVDYIDKQIVALAIKYKKMYNHGKTFHNCANLTDLAGGNTTYTQLTKDECSVLFDKAKVQAIKRAPILTPQAQLAEISLSFLSVACELDALTACHKVHALVVLTRSSLKFPMAPKVYTATRAVKQYFRVNFWSNLNEFASRMKGNMIAKIWSNSTMEYMRHEANIVCRYNVKLIGWENELWVNPSYLKGRLIALEKLADTITDKRCWFVKITPEEVEEQCAHVEGALAPAALFLPSNQAVNVPADATSRLGTQPPDTVAKPDNATSEISAFGSMPAPARKQHKDTKSVHAPKAKRSKANASDKPTKLRKPHAKKQSEMVPPEADA